MKPYYLFLAVIFISACSPKFTLPSLQTPELATTDTVTWIKFERLDGSVSQITLDSLMQAGRIIVDTIEIAGEYVEIHDTIPCPEGLDTTTYIPTTKIHFLPGRRIPVVVTVHDTIFRPYPVIKQIPALTTTSTTDWGERLAWASAVLFLLAGYWKRFRNQKED